MCLNIVKYGLVHGESSLFIFRVLRNFSESHYDRLGIKPNATSKEIKNAYYSLCKKYHPDVTRQSTDSALTAKFLEVKSAYDTLRDPQKRRHCRYPYHPQKMSWQWVDQSKSWRDYSESDIRKVYEYIRKFYPNDVFQNPYKEYRQKAWNEVLRQRAEYLKRRAEKANKAFNEKP